MRSSWALTVCLALLILSPLAGAGSSDPREVRLRARSFTPPATIEGALLKPAEGKRRYAYLQLHQEASLPKAREALGKLGLHLLRPLGSRTFFVSLPQKGVNAKSLYDVRWLGAIPARDKILPRLLRDRFVPGNQGRRVNLLVQFHPDVPLEEWDDVVKRVGASILDRAQSVTVAVVDLPKRKILQLAGQPEVQWIEEPLTLEAVNDEARHSNGAAVANEPPYNLDGSGVTVLVYDGGPVDANHPDLADHCTVGEAGSPDYHATHVACTIGGSGANSEAHGGQPYQWRGMAPGVDIVSFEFHYSSQGIFLYNNPGDIEDNYREAINDYGAVLSNNSIGSNTAPNGFPCEITGDYCITASLLDSIIGGTLGQPMRIVWAAGNERQTPRCGETYYTSAPPSNAKNIVNVGAINSNDLTMTDFSSWGPADDGRIRPDVVAPGCATNADDGLVSCDTGGDYQSLCGTSMASPATTGVSALLLQAFRQAEDDDEFLPLPSTLRAILVQGAVDLGRPGPDFIFGNGLIQADKSADIILSRSWTEDAVAMDESRTFYLVVGPDTPEVRVTLTWTDTPGTPNAALALVNDLDLVVTDPSGARRYPWTLDPEQPEQEATRHREDHLNNLEQVLVDSGPQPGIWLVEVRGTMVVEGAQAFSLALTPTYTGLSSFGIISLDKAQVGCSASLSITVSDLDLGEGSMVEVEAFTPEGDRERIALRAMDGVEGVLSGTVTLQGGRPVPHNGVLEVVDGSTVSIIYVDADDGLGNQNVPKEAQASVDCTPPVISDIHVTDITPQSATIHWITDEPAKGQIQYGSQGTLDQAVSETAFNQGHAITLSDLDSSQVYSFIITAMDQAGNEALAQAGELTTIYMVDILNEDFEGEVIGWTHEGEGDEWEMGTPPGLEPHSGENCYMTDLDNSYESRADAWLQTPLFPLSGTAAHLSFFHAYNTESSYDYGQVEIALDSQPFAPLDAGRKYYNTVSTWAEEVLDLTGLQGVAQLRFRFRSDSYGRNGAGWAIDDVKVQEPLRQGVHLREMELDDLTDGDGWVEPGEKAAIALSVENREEVSLSGVVAYLSLGDPHVFVTSNRILIGDLAPGVTPLLAETFRLEVSPSCPDPHRVTAVVTFTAQGQEWSDSITLDVRTASEVRGRVVDLDSGQAVPTATVMLDNEEQQAGPAGEFAFTGQVRGSHTLSATAPGFLPADPIKVIVPPDSRDIIIGLGTPRLRVEPEAVGLVTNQGVSVTGPLTLHNDGTVTLHAQLSISGGSWASVQPGSVEVAPGENTIVEVTARPGAAQPNVYEATIVIASDDLAQPSLRVPLSLEVLAGPILSVRGHSIDDALGDGDGHGEAGETLALLVEMENRGSSRAEGAWLEVLESLGCAKVTDDRAGFEAIEPGGVMASLDSLGLELAPDCQAGSSVTLRVRFGCGNGGPWETNMVVVVESMSRVWGQVRDREGRSLGDAEISYAGPASATVRSDDQGQFNILDLPNGEYSVVARAEGHLPSEAVVITLPPDQRSLDFELCKALIWMDPHEAVFYALPGEELSREVSLMSQIQCEASYQARSSSDSGDYEVLSSDDPYGPEYRWVDIVGQGQRFADMGDDSQGPPIDLDFSMPFYDGEFSTLRFCTNGWLSFTNTSTAYSNYALPSTSAPENLIAILWDDLNVPSGQGEIWVREDEEGVVVSYIDVPTLSGGGSNTFQAILRPSGDILMQYAQVSSNSRRSCTAGIQDATKRKGVQLVYNGDYLHDEMAVLISAVPPWLTMTPDEGQVAPGSRSRLALQVDAEGLEEGTLRGWVKASVRQLEAQVAVTLVVSPDGDGDGLPDQWEDDLLRTRGWSGDDDPDEDGLTNREERLAGTDPLEGDTDGDGLADGEERSAGRDPLSRMDILDDEDNDGLDPAQEALAGTDPSEEDSDGDGVGDGADLCPLVSDPQQEDCNHDGVGDACDPYGCRGIIWVDGIHGDDTTADGSSIRPYATLNAAMDNAPQGAIVRARPAVYAENVDFAGREITLEAQPGAIIDAGGQAEGVVFASGEDRNSELLGFVIVNGYGLSGGGVLVQDAAPTIIGNIIMDSQAEEGGAMAILDASAPLVTNNIVVGGSASRGGALFCADAAPEITNNSLVDSVSDPAAGALELGLGCNALIEANVVAGSANMGLLCGPGSSSWVGYNNVVQSGRADYGGSCQASLGRTGNISLPPQMMAPEAYDFRLLPASPGVDGAAPDREDGCLPPGQGGMQADQGALGGPYACRAPKVSTMVVRLVDRRGGMLSGVEVTALTANDQAIRRISDEQGKAQFALLPPGLVELMVEGREALNAPRVSLPPSQLRTVVLMVGDL